MRMVLTGAAGFIGRHLVRRLRSEGHQVVGLDRRLGADLQIDLLESDLRPLVAGAEIVIHLAGQPGVRESWGQFSAYSRGNIETTQRLLEALRDQPPRKFVLASTSSVYGDAPMPAAEEGPVYPISPYGATKLAAEQICDLYQRTCGIPWVALRYFTAYGPGQRPDMAFSRWFQAALAGRPVTIYGTGDQARDFTYVDDIVEATLRAALAPVTGPLNVGGGSFVPIRTALGLIEEITGVTLELQHLSPAAGDMQVTQADTSRLLAETGYQPATPLKIGLRRQWDSILTGV